MGVTAQSSAGANMQLDQVAKLRRAWAAKGNPPCDHPELAREYSLGSNTGDKVCTTCGEGFGPPELAQMGR